MGESWERARVESCRKIGQGVGLLPQDRTRKHGSLFDNSSVKVVIIGCAAIIVALLVMSQSSIMIMRDAVVHKLKTNDLGNLAASISAVIEGKIDKATDLSLMMASDPVTIGWLDSAERDQQAGTLGQEKMISIVDTLGYNTAFLVSDVTKHYWSYHQGVFNLLDTVSEQDVDDQWFFTSMAMGKRYEINIDHNKELGDTFVWINTLVGDLQSPIAVTGLGMNLSDVIDELVLAEEQSKVKNDIWLVDGAGVIYLAKDPSFRERSVQDILPQEIVTQMTGDGSLGEDFIIDEYTGADGGVNDIAYKRIKHTAWTLVVQIPRAESVGFLKTVTSNTIVSCVVIILLMVATFYLLANRIANPYKRAVQLNQQLEGMVEERTRELQEKNAKIQDSLEYAKMIQQTILPSDVELRRNLRDHFVIFQPREAVGGDFYWMRGGSEGCWLVVGDCTGHGVPGALMTTAVNAMLNNILDTNPSQDPVDILKNLERLIRQSFTREGDDQVIADGLDAAVIYISRAGQVSFAGANIPVYVSDSRGVREIKGTNATIDCISTGREKLFVTHDLSWDEETIFYVATDGYKDQPGGERHLPFGKARLTALLAEIREMSLEQQASHLLQALEQYAGSEARRDDVTVLGFKLWARRT